MAQTAPLPNPGINQANKALGTQSLDSWPSTIAQGGSHPTPPNIGGPASNAAHSPVVGMPGGNLSAADAQIKATLAQYGLETLAPWAWAKIQAGEDINQIVLELRATPEYKARFPAMEALSKQGMALSETQYIDLERTYKQIMHSAGLPTGFFDSPDQLGSFMLNNISPSELSSRVQDYQAVAFNSPPEVQAELQRLYGVGPGELTAYFIDPAQATPLLHQKVMASQIAGQADVSQFGQLTQDEAEMLAKSGVTQDQARSGFQQIGLQKQLFSGLPGEAGVTDVTQNTALQAQFMGNAAAALTIKNRAQNRLATFQDAYGYLSSATQGAVGIGEEKR